MTLNRIHRNRLAGALSLAMASLAGLLLSACEGRGAVGRAGAAESGAPAARAEGAGDGGETKAGLQGPSRPVLDFGRIGYDQGSPDAPVKVVEISDFGCGYCRVFNQEVFPVLLEEFIESGRVQWKFVPFVLGIFPNGDKAALAGECAGEQGLEPFLRMRGRLFSEQAGWRDTQDPDEFFARLAKEEGLREGRFRRCLEDGQRAEQVQLDIRLGQALGTQGTPMFIVDGLPLSGALPAESFRRLLNLLLAEKAGPSRDWLPPPPTGGNPSMASLILSMGMGHGVGSPDAPIHIIEFSDFGCGYCRVFQEQTRPLLVAEYVDTGKVRWTYIPFVLGIFPNGDAAAVASECGAEQGLFEPLRKRLYQDQPGWRNDGDPKPFFARIAEEEGLDAKRFSECLEGEGASARIQENNRMGQMGGVRGTPAFFVNGFPVSGALGLEAFRDLLDLEMSSLPGRRPTP